MVQAMDQEVVERTCKLWIREQLKEILMVCKQWKEQWMVQAIDHEAVDGDMDQEAVEGAIYGASDGRSDR